MAEWCGPITCRPFFRPARTPAQERLQARFLVAVARSLDREAAELAIPTAEWALELLSSDGHLCPVVNVESHQGFLRPVGIGGWSAHELHCVIDWSCNGWCRQRAERGLADVEMVLAGQADPAVFCAFRAYFASLQGRFGLPTVRDGERSRQSAAAAAVCP